MTSLRGFAMRHRDQRLGQALDACVCRVSSGAPDCTVGAFFASGPSDRGRWATPSRVPGKLPVVPAAPAVFDGVKALNFVHKNLYDKALMTGDSRYLAALRSCRWHRNTSDECPVYRDYLREAAAPPAPAPGRSRD
jgi:hypothetical protein